MAETGSILIVEDELNVGSTLLDRLKAEGYQAFWVKNCSEALKAIERQPFDLALLDVGLPDGNGFDIAKRIRELQLPSALVFLTAFGSPQDRVRGLELGAEDYVVKPFHLKELLLRIKNALKRAQYITTPGKEPTSDLKIGRAEIHFKKFLAKVDGEEVSLTHKECALLKLLVEKRGEVVSRDEILNQVWSEDEFPTSRTVDNFILKLRKLIEPNPENPTIIKSIRGVGYQLI